MSLLAREPLSGYDLAQQMKGRVEAFWHARHSQIYPELAQLQAQGLVTHEVIEQRDRPAKKLYTITEAGDAVLRTWVTKDVEVPAVRDELVLKAYTVWLANPEQAIALFREHERRHLEQLGRYEQIQERVKQVWESSARRLDSPWFATYAALRRGIGFEQEYAAWCHWVAEELERGSS